MMFQLPLPDAEQTRQEKCLDYQNTNYGSPVLVHGARADANDAGDNHDDDDDDSGANVSEETEQKLHKIRSSRQSRLKDRLNWFSSRSRQRLSSFGSSDNLKYVREGFLRSRDKLSVAFSPVRGRNGSYQFVDCDLDTFPSQGNVCVRGGTWK